jgi:hypothetical protein
MHDQSGRSLSPLLVLAACAFMGAIGCEPQPVAAPPPPPPRALTVYPEQKQSQAQQNRDQAQCQNTANAQATSSESWAQIFAACMSGRGYGVR